ncbi:MAG: putative 2-dehydropantoate 2-reductase [Leptolyngbyaceae cyanobacterium SM1_3_5]|nr:putative 2-dehydropantoate 2-reductase [Leptolyngbyaceae cyanobacterium SM1_3_5]
MTFTYAILGTGALGGFYGARLQQAGLQVHFLLHSDYETVRHQGLKIDSPDENCTLPKVHAYHDVAEMPQCDVAIVALKTTQNHLLPTLLPPVLKENGAILVLQNGLSIETAVAEIVGINRVVGGLCFLCANKIAPGHIHHLDYKKITLGEYRSNYQTVGVSDRMRQIAQDFERAKIPIELAEDLLTARWKKLVWNIPFNGLSVVLNAETDEMMADDSTRSLAEDLMREVLQGAAACGRSIDHNFIATMLNHTIHMKPYRTSMKLDYDNGRPLEIQAIFANPLQMARSNGIDLPKIEMLYQQLNFLDRNRFKVGRGDR